MKKAWSIIGRVFTIIVVIFTVFVMLFTMITVGSTKDVTRYFLGYKPYIVLSDSMHEVFAVGDIAVSKRVDPMTLKEGDIISFQSIDPNNYGEVMTHKIREITTYKGDRAFVTYGVNTGVDDAYPVPYYMVVGQYKFKIPKMGYFFQFLKTPLGYFTVILIPFLILIGIQAFHFFKLVKQYKVEQQAELEEQRKQQQAELDAQRAAIDKEKMENIRMREELERLKAEMAAKQDADRTDGPEQV